MLRSCRCDCYHNFDTELVSFIVINKKKHTCYGVVATLGRLSEKILMLSFHTCTVEKQLRRSHRNIQETK